MGKINYIHKYYETAWYVSKTPKLKPFENIPPKLNGISIHRVP